MPFGNELIDDCAKKLTIYQIDVDVKSNHEILIRVTQKNIHYVCEHCHDDGLILLVGDSCNRLLLYEDM